MATETRRVGGMKEATQADTTRGKAGCVFDLNCQVARPKELSSTRGGSATFRNSNPPFRARGCSEGDAVFLSTGRGALVAIKVGTFQSAAKMTRLVQRGNAPGGQARLRGHCVNKYRLKQSADSPAGWPLRLAVCL